MEQSESQSTKDFDVIKELGVGSFGKVNLVKRKTDQTIFAMKTVSLTRLNQKEKDSALNQIRLLASINIPTVIKYEGSFFDTDTQQLCVLMQFADGGDLQGKIIDRQNTIPGQGFDESFIWKTAFEILHGLKNLHKKNIIHRDIKSANIFFVKGVAKLGDLNVSKIAEDGFCSTQTGTPYYTSPQVWSGQRYGNKCDIWSLGCLTYELCTLKVPFKASDFPGLYRKITKGEYSDISSKYSDKMKKFIQMCLTVDEEMRPSATQLLENSMFTKIQKENQDLKGGRISIMESIKCPKVLKFLNSKLPQPKNIKEDGQKKIVNFTQAKQIQEITQQTKENTQYRKIRSEKVIKWAEQDTLHAPRNHLARPNKQKQGQVPSQKNISNGLVFSTKRIKIKPTSTKLISDLRQ